MSPTLIPFLDSLKGRLSRTFKQIIADAGYESEENDAYLKENHQKVSLSPSTMKPQKQESIKLNWGNEKTWRTMNSTIPIRAQMAER